MNTSDLSPRLRNWTLRVSKTEVLWLFLSNYLSHDVSPSLPKGEPKTLLNLCLYFSAFLRRCIMYVSSLKLRWHFEFNVSEIIIYIFCCDFLLLHLIIFLRLINFMNAVLFITWPIAVFHWKIQFIYPFSWLLNVCFVSSVLLHNHCSNFHSYVCFLVYIQQAFPELHSWGKCWDFRICTISTLLDNASFPKLLKTVYILQ